MRGTGSQFTLYLPPSYVVPSRRRDEDRSGSTARDRADAGDLAAPAGDSDSRTMIDVPSLEARRTRREDGARVDDSRS